MKIPDRFMVVDDDKTTTILCEHVLKKFSRVTPLKSFIDPETALESIKQEYGQPNVDISTVMFLDINMPSMTSWEFLDVFKDFSPQIHRQFTIYVLSSSIDERDKEKSESNLFVSGHLSKPLKLESVRHIFNIVSNPSIVFFNKLKPL